MRRDSRKGRTGKRADISRRRNRTDRRTDSCHVRPLRLAIAPQNGRHIVTESFSGWRFRQRILGGSDPSGDRRGDSDSTLGTYGEPGHSEREVLDILEAFPKSQTLPCPHDPGRQLAAGRLPASTPRDATSETA